MSIFHSFMHYLYLYKNSIIKIIHLRKFEITLSIYLFSRIISSKLNKLITFLQYFLKVNRVHEHTSKKCTRSFKVHATSYLPETFTSKLLAKSRGLQKRHLKCDAFHNLRHLKLYILIYNA